MKNGNERELEIFLLEFNISVDLTFPPRTHNNFKGVKSKGNIGGLIPNHSHNIFKSNIKKAYKACLNRLLHNLSKHVNTPQVDKINNYMMILSSLTSLIWTIGDIIYREYKDTEVVKVASWSSIRDYYDMLFMYLNNSLDILLGDDKYKDRINKKIINDDIFEVYSFNQYLINEYIDTIKEIMEYATNTIEYFENIKNGLKVQMDDGNQTKAVIFENDIHLQKYTIEKIQKNIKKLQEVIHE